MQETEGSKHAHINLWPNSPFVHSTIWIFLANRPQIMIKKLILVIHLLCAAVCAVQLNSRGVVLILLITERGNKTASNQTGPTKLKLKMICQLEKNMLIIK